jgi:hypothetical protein
MLIEHILGDTLHAKNLYLKTLSARKRILDLCEVFFVDLVHVHGETCGESCQRGFRGIQMIVNVPPAVLRRRPQRSHLKCFAFW